jgi:sporulation protein YlmC with PRC-barrel domain
MLRSLKDIERYKVSASDGDIGDVENFLLDDKHWVVRYLIVDTGGFFDGRRVLISPISFRDVDWLTKRFHLALTKDKVQNSPSVNVDKPVTRQHELDYYGHYRYPHYWGSSWYWGSGNTPSKLANGKWTKSAEDPSDDAADVHLRSVNEVRGYYIQGSDGPIGHVEDFIVDDETWEVRYLVIDTSNWWFGKRVLIAPRWASRISWEKKIVYVEMSRDSIKNSPELDPGLVINREYETHLYAYFGRPAYWTREDRPK